MASSPLRAPVGQSQSRLLDMQQKFRQKHLATVTTVKGTSPTSSNTSPSITIVNNVGGVQPVPAVRRSVGVSPPQSQNRPGVNGQLVDVQVDVKGKVRQLFAERNKQQHTLGPGYHHYQQQQQQQQQQQRHRRRSLTGRDRSRPLRPLSDAKDDSLCKTVCFTAPSMIGGTDMTHNGRDVRGELLELFGRLPNLGGQLLSESFRKDGSKMKTAQSAPELKWLLDGAGYGPGPPVPEAGPGKDGGGPEQSRRTVAATGSWANNGAAAATGTRGTKGAAVTKTGDGDDDYGLDDDDDDQLQMRPTGRTNNTKMATIAKKPLAAVNSNGVTGPGGVGRGARKPAVHNDVNKSPGTATAFNANRLLLPPVVQPTVINALAAGQSAAAAVASVNAAASSGVQKPVFRAAKLPPATQQQQRPAVPARRRVQAAPSSPPKASVPASRLPATVPSNTTRQTLSPKKQLSEDRGPPAKGMARCPLCARDFAADRLPKHEEVCRRSRERDLKRKVFDTSRKRLEAVAAEAGVDVTSFKKKSQKEDQRAAEKLQKKKDVWRRKHDALVRNVRAARAVQRHLAAGGTMRDLPPELENAGTEQDDEVDSDLVKCPHCSRTFNEASAERHIPLCADRQRNAAARLQNKKR